MTQRTEVGRRKARQRRLGWMLAAGGMLLVSTDSLWVRLSQTRTWDAAFVVGVLSLALYGMMAARQWRSVRLSVKTHAAPLAAASVLGTVSQLSFIAAITHTKVPHVVAIVASAPVIAAGLAWLGLRERTSPRVAAGIAFTVAGIGMIVADSVGTPNLLGDALALLAVIAFAASTVVWRRHRDMSRIAGLAISSACMVAISAVAADPWNLDAKALAALAVMGLVCNPLGRLAYTNAPKHAPAGEVALFAPVETVAGIAWAVIFLAEYPAPITIVGAVVVVFGMLYATVMNNQTGVSEPSGPQPRMTPTAHDPSRE